MNQESYRPVRSGVYGVIAKQTFPRDSSPFLATFAERYPLAEIAAMWNVRREKARLFHDEPGVIFHGTETSSRVQYLPDSGERGSTWQASFHELLISVAIGPPSRCVEASKRG